MEVVFVCKKGRLLFAIYFLLLRNAIQKEWFVDPEQWTRDTWSKKIKVANDGIHRTHFISCFLVTVMVQQLNILDCRKRNFGLLK